MRLRHIEIFNAVYSTGSISSAARFLNITQPTVSKVLKHAEDQLGFLLFKRTKGKLIPTSEAIVLYEETHQIDKKISSLKKTAANLQNSEQGIIKLAVIHALGMELIPRAIVEYTKKFPQMHFEVQSLHYDNLLSFLYDRDKDVGIALNPPKKAGITQVDVCSGEFVCIYSKDEFDHIPYRINLSDIEGKPFVNIADSGPLYDLITAQISQENIKHYSVITAQTYFMVRNLVALGAGISIVDEYTARSMGVGKVKVRGFNPPLTFSVKALHLENKIPSKASLDFITFFKEKILDKLPPIENGSSTES